MDIRTPVMCCFMVLTMLVLAEVYLELDEVRVSLNEKTLVLNKEFKDLGHLKTMAEFYNEQINNQE